LCGCAALNSPAIGLPPANTPIQCLATSGSGLALRKRVQVFSTSMDGYYFVCNADTNTGNPFQACLNLVGALCNPSYIYQNEQRKKNCRLAVDSIVNGLNSNWKLVRNKCGQWSSSFFTKGNYLSVDCANANLNLQAKAYYIATEDNSLWPVTRQLTDSLQQGLWNNPQLST
jgi:hypothetical protein